MVRHVLDAKKRKEAQKRIPAILLEIDYELVTLHDAMLEKDTTQMDKTKLRLKELRKHLLELKE